MFNLYPSAGNRRLGIGEILTDDVLSPDQIWQIPGRGIGIRAWLCVSA